MKCRAKQFSDQMSCDCGLTWDANDPDPPKCPGQDAKPTPPATLRVQRDEALRAARKAEAIVTALVDDRRRDTARKRAWDDADAAYLKELAEGIDLDDVNGFEPDRVVRIAGRLAEQSALLAVAEERRAELITAREEVRSWQNFSGQQVELIHWLLTALKPFSDAVDKSESSRKPVACYVSEIDWASARNAVNALRVRGFQPKDRLQSWVRSGEKATDTADKKDANPQ